ncbi:type IV secretory system conjugative DNA transfer family protein [Prosthecobacter sp.]|uniref:type IV secretory system conjugative DNA transfer family protein n=1 Tax=Prosthecobacter sp. TaxID=1965333 RepID=UPI0037841128
MITPHEQLSAQYLQWELRGRGWFVHQEPVALEPPFQPFRGYHFQSSSAADDVRKASFAERLLKKAGRLLNPPATPDAEADDTDSENEISTWSREGCSEIALTFPRASHPKRDHAESFLRMCRSCGDPVAFEVLADHREIGFQWVCSAKDEPFVKAQCEAHFSEWSPRAGDAQLVQAWEQTGTSYAAAEIGLGRDFLLSIETGKTEMLSGLIAGMSSLAEGEMALFQVIFEPVAAPWADGMVQVSTKSDGVPVFKNRPDLAREAATKASSPLYAVVLRLVTCAEDGNRAWALLAPLVAALNALSRPGGNHLVPLAMNDYASEAQEADILRRQSHRWGMVLSQEELLSLIRLPDDRSLSKRLRQDSGQTRAYASDTSSGLLIGWNVHAGRRQEVYLTPEQRVRHLHAIGGTGTGKTTFLANLIRQDMESGQGFALLDPHGDLVDRLLSIVPESRLDDVVLIDAGDEEFSVGFNILSAKADYEKTLLASDLVSVFQRLSTSWGDQMTVVLRNAILAFLERPEGGTLADVQRFLLEPDFRASVLESVQDADVVYYWRKGFPQLGGSKSIGPVLTRLQTFLSPKPIRYMVGQRDAKLDIAEIMDSGKILLVKLPQGLMGAENSYLLGSLIVSKIQQAAMARQRMAESQRRLFTLYVDEFQNFITPSMAEILSGARKYRLALVLAHQELAQLGRNDAVASAVLANAGTRVVFRVGDSDARELAKGFAHFEPEALQSLAVGEAIIRVERSDQDFNLSVPADLSAEPGSEERQQEVITRSRLRYAVARSEIEAKERKRLADLAETMPSKGKKIFEPPPTPAPEPVEPPVIPPPIPAKEEPVEVASETQAEQPQYGATTLKADLEELGRGGDIHRAAQAEFKRLAEARGFRATIERQLPDSQDTVDLYIERDGVSIACEVSVTNTLEYEMKNITKCLRAGVQKVLVLTVEPEKHRRLSAAIASLLSPEQQEKVLCLQKDEFDTFLASVSPKGNPSPPEPATEGKPKMVKGWKVRTNSIPAPIEDLPRLEKEMAATMAENLRRGKTKKRVKKGGAST